MRLEQIFKIAIISILAFFIPSSNAVTLNFSAILANATCSISLDKSIVALGNIAASSLKENKLLGLNEFNLSVQNCTSIDDSGTFLIKVTGNGKTNDGRWIFNNNPESGGAGIMLFQSKVTPIYSDSEIKNQSEIIISNAGIVPIGTTLKFYAAASCGGGDGCASVSPGEVSATIFFDFIYR